MKIGIDARALVNSKTGIGVYTYEIIKRLNKLDNNNTYYLYSNKKIELDFQLNKNFILCEKNFKIGTVWLYYKLPRKLKEDEIDVFWGTQHCLPKRNKYTKSIKYLLTIHDIALEKIKGIGSLYNTIIQKLVLKVSCKNADKIITVSKSTKNDLVEILEVKKNKISVVYAGVSQQLVKCIDEINIKKISDKFNLSGKNFFFFLSTIEPRKNLSTALKAFEIIKQKEESKNLVFIISGKKGWKCQSMLELIEKSKYKKDIILTGYITEDEKNFFYRKCIAFVYPSLYEGFGLPVLEAMKNSSLVITSNNSSLPEVAADAAIYLQDVCNENELAGLFEKAIKMEKIEKEKRLNIGLQRVQTFTWEKCAKNIFKILEDMCNE